MDTDEEKQKQRQIRASDKRWLAYKAAAEKVGLSTSEFIRASVDAAAKRVLLEDDEAE